MEVRVQRKSGEGRYYSVQTPVGVEAIALQKVFPPQVWCSSANAVLPFFGWGAAMTSPIADQAQPTAKVREAIAGSRQRASGDGVFVVIFFREGTRHSLWPARQIHR